MRAVIDYVHLAKVKIYKNNTPKKQELETKARVLPMDRSNQTINFMLKNLKKNHSPRYGCFIIKGFQFVMFCLPTFV